MTRPVDNFHKFAIKNWFCLKKMDKINDRLNLFDFKVFDLKQKTDKYGKEVRDIKGIIELNDKFVTKFSLILFTFVEIE